MNTPYIIKASDYFSDRIPFHMVKSNFSVFDEAAPGCHYHSHEFIEIAFVCQGKGSHLFNRKRDRVSRGDIYIINFDSAHQFMPLDRQNSGNLAVINCLFLPEFVQDLKIELSLLKEITQMFLVKSIYRDEALASIPDLKLQGELLTNVSLIYDRMYREYTDKPEGYVEVIKLLLCDLLVQLYRAYKRSLRDFSEGEQYKHQLINDTIAYLYENFPNNLSLDTISQHAFLSKSYFTRLFKKATGMSVFEYLQKIRMEKACELLVNCSHPVTAIMEHVGYSHYGFFNEAFKRHTGLTASEFRKKYRRD